MREVVTVDEEEYVSEGGMGEEPVDEVAGGECFACAGGEDYECAVVVVAEVFLELFYCFVLALSESARGECGEPGEGVGYVEELCEGVGCGEGGECDPVGLCFAVVLEEYVVTVGFVEEGYGVLPGWGEFGAEFCVGYDLFGNGVVGDVGVFFFCFDYGDGFACEEEGVVSTEVAFGGEFTYGDGVVGGLVVVAVDDGPACVAECVVDVGTGLFFGCHGGGNFCGCCWGVG